jgi:mRNA degradation ribonuclease J1/J2
MQVAPQKLPVLISGTRRAHVGALARCVDNHNMFGGTGNTVVLSSRIIPGNESHLPMIDHMSRRGADVMWIMNPPPYPATSMEELTLMLNLVQPKYFVIHGATGKWRSTRSWPNTHSGLKDCSFSKPAALEIDDEGKEG